MTDYKKYINALRKCAKEHEGDKTFTGQIIVSNLCRDTANLLETLEQEPFINKPCVSNEVCEHDKNVVLDKIKAEIEQLPTNTRINWDGCCPDIVYPEIEFVDVSKAGLLEIINKYKAETEGKE